MTEQEYQALVNILGRVPVSPAEALWLNSLLAQLRPLPEQKGSRDQHNNPVGRAG